MSEILIPQKISVLDLLPPDEGEINQYYGRIGSGKTYTATADILRDLKRGQVVYANWKINFQGYDESKIWWKKWAYLLGLKRQLLVVPKENFHYFPISSDFTEKLSSLTDCKIYLDEGHLALDSYELSRMDISKRAAILHTRHFNRTINVISQRAMAIHVTVRANVNRFYRCECLFNLFGILLFRKTEFQDLMAGSETVDEDQEISRELYLGRKAVFNVYDTKYLRGDMPTSQTNFAYFLKPSLKQLFHLKENKPKTESGPLGLN